MQTLAGPFCFHSKISPGTGLSKMDPIWTNLRMNSVVCNQMLSGSNMKYDVALDVWLVDLFVCWLVVWLVV